MPNHYHLVIYIKETSEVSTAMMKLSVSYTKTINIHYDRVGPLFQGAFQAKFVDSAIFTSIQSNPVWLKNQRIGCVRVSMIIWILILWRLPGAIHSETSEVSLKRARLCPLSTIRELSLLERL
jgi:hypothetical protein